MAECLTNVAAERAVLAATMKSAECFYDVADVLKDSTFSIESNKVLYKIVSHIYGQNSNSKIDLPSIYVAAQELNLKYFFDKKTEVQHLEAILNFPIKAENARKFALQIKRLEIARLLHGELENAQTDLLDVTGSESITEILGIAENKILDFGSSLNDNSESPILISSSIDAYIDNLEKEVIDQLGLPTGFPAYDSAIGGGLRKSVISLVAARPKKGKSSFATNVACNLTQLNIPVLKLDLEMSQEDDTCRLIANLAEVNTREIETGQYTRDSLKKKRVYEAREKIRKLPYYFKSIAQKTPDEIIGIARRWLMKDVGLNFDGTVSRDCLVIYDYLRTSNEKDIQNAQEFQMLGFIMSALSAFAIKYKVPILLLSQLGREGAVKEEVETISASDRIAWIAGNVSIIRGKSEEEIAMDGDKAGDTKIVTLAARHGPGSLGRDYVSLRFCKEYTKMYYLGSRAEIAQRERLNEFEYEEVPFNQ